MSNLKLADIPIAVEVESDHDYRIMAMRIPANDCYASKLVVFAMPGLTDANPDIVGRLVITEDSFFKEVDWIGVNQDYRRCGIGRRMWKAAEAILGRSIVHNPVTDDGEKFAAAIEREESSTKGV